MPNEPNWEELLKPQGGRPSSQEMMKVLKWVQPIAVVVLVVLWLATGIYIVGPAEVGVVRTFGKETSKKGPGLRYHLPLPMQQVDVVDVEKVWREEIGFYIDRRRHDSPRTVRVPKESLMLTGDENIVDAQVVVQYKIKDPSQYLFRLLDPTLALRASAEVALRSAVGNTTIDEILTVGRAKAQQDTKVFLQKLLDLYESGLQVDEVLLQVVDPPDQVKDAFHEVVRAREDREKLVRQAEGYEEDIIPKARGKAKQMVRGAEAYKEEQVLRAQGDTARFLALLTEYRKAPAVTRTRLQLDASQAVLVGNETVVMNPSAAKQVAPFLPLRGFAFEQQAKDSAGGIR